MALTRGRAQWETRIQETRPLEHRRPVQQPTRPREIATESSLPQRIGGCAGGCQWRRTMRYLPMRTGQSQPPVSEPGRLEIQGGRSRLRGGVRRQRLDRCRVCRPKRGRRPRSDRQHASLRHAHLSERQGGLQSGSRRAVRSGVGPGRHVSSGCGCRCRRADGPICHLLSRHDADGHAEHSLQLSNRWGPPDDLQRRRGAGQGIEIREPFQDQRTRWHRGKRPS